MKIIIELEAEVELKGNVTVDEILYDNPPFRNVAGGGADSHYRFKTGKVVGWREQPPKSGIVETKDKPFNEANE